MESTTSLAFRGPGYGGGRLNDAKSVDRDYTVIRAKYFTSDPIPGRFLYYERLE